MLALTDLWNGTEDFWFADSASDGMHSSYLSENLKIPSKSSIHWHHVSVELV